MKLIRDLTSRITNENGLTLMELVICLGLASLLGLGAYQMISIIFKDWNHTSASQSAVLQTNEALTLISRDIRAAERPNKDSLAVVKIDASTLDIYHFNNDRYERIQYRLYKNDATDSCYILQRGTVDTDTPDNSANPQYGSIDWGNARNLVEGLTDVNVFDDVTSLADSERRSISVSFHVEDTRHSPALFDPLVVNSIFMSRSQEIGGLSGGGGGSYIPVAGLSLDPPQLTFVSGYSYNTGPLSKPVNMVIYPDNASNRAVKCTPGQVWIHYAVNNDVITVTVDKNSGGARSGTLKVETLDGGWTSSAVINQNAKNH